MDLNEKELAPILAKMGRTILPDAIYGKHVSVVGASLTKTSKKYVGELCEATVDLYKIDPKTGEKYLAQRRIYGADGKAVQDIGYYHNNDLGRHLFPHIHVWIDGKRIDKNLKHRRRNNVRD